MICFIPPFLCLSVSSFLFLSRLFFSFEFSFNNGHVICFQSELCHDVSNGFIMDMVAARSWYCQFISTGWSPQRAKLSEWITTVYYITNHSFSIWIALLHCWQSPELPGTKKNRRKGKYLSQPIELIFTNFFWIVRPSSASVSPHHHPQQKLN